jgi:transposase
MKTVRSFVGMDVHKATISISVAEDGRSGSVRFIGVIPNTPEAVHKMAKQLARHGELDFCYEASGDFGNLAWSTSAVCFGPP